MSSERGGGRGGGKNSASLPQEKFPAIEKRKGHTKTVRERGWPQHHKTKEKAKSKKRRKGQLIVPQGHLEPERICERGVRKRYKQQITGKGENGGGAERVVRFHAS